MSLNGPLQQVKRYTDGRTKQCFKEECDIGKIMARAEKAGTISHLDKYEGVYGDFSDYDFFTQEQKMAEGQQIFADLPAEIRREFAQSPGAFFAYVNDPENKNKLREILPALAAPGTQLVDVVPPDADTEAAQAAAAAPAAITPAAPAAAPVAPQAATQPPAG